MKNYFFRMKTFKKTSERFRWFLRLLETLKRTARVDLCLSHSKVHAFIISRPVLQLLQLLQLHLGLLWRWSSSENIVPQSVQQWHLCTDTQFISSPEQLYCGKNEWTHIYIQHLSPVLLPSLYDTCEGFSICWRPDFLLESSWSL